ncbi:hypothetical protein [Fibrobacter sp. UWB11]|uniref:hypothetical protein n=1 Tax=Fibrobacter sp. UWB11 TaxID=1896202 RepID=UPI0009285AD2|nr:hypothetical protein [Fibrobacter sp. UWB11]SIN83252.1 hypothetical protein SAMN05720758_0136 [Fibrobacter sp. UWB11]
MQKTSPKFSKSKFEACCNFWQPLVKKIYAQNADVIFLHRRDVLAALKRLQKAKPDYGFEISYKQESKGYRDCDKSQVICLRKSLGGAASIEFLVDCDAKYLSIRFCHIDAGNFNVPYERCWCNLDATLENLVKFVDEFPNYNEQSSRIIMEIEKEQKLQEITQNTIRATVSNIMNSTKHQWKLFETENSFSLDVAFDKGYTIQMSFDIQNYLERIPALQNVLEQTENFLKEIPFPISIKALDKSRF